MWYKYPMEKGLTQELASELKKHLAENEDWLIKRALFYAKKNGYTAYAPTLEGAWRVAVRGISQPLLDTPSTSFWMPELHPHFDFEGDEFSQFGIKEAKRHRERGIDLTMFLGLFKYFRQTYEDLLFRLDFDLDSTKRCRTFLKRYFDRVELGFIKEWTRQETSEVNRKIAEANMQLLNEKSLVLTTLESLKQPVMVFSEKNDMTLVNHSACELFAGYTSPGTFYYSDEKVRIPTILEKRVVQFFDEHKLTEEFTMSFSGRIYDVSFNRMKDVSGKFLGLVVLLNDITDKRTAESYLKESEALRKAFMEGVDAAALVLDMETHEVTDLNTRAEELFGSCGFQDDGLRFYEEVGGAPFSIFDLADSSVNNEERYVDICKGRFRPVRMFSIEVWFLNKRHKIMIIFDISREKMLETRATHLQHLEILGDIAGSMPVMLKESTARLQRYLASAQEKGAFVKEELDEALGYASEIQEMLAALESIARYETERDVIDLNQVIKNCIILTKDKWSPYSDVSINLGNGVRGVYCSPDEMGQVFLNMLVNAAYAVRKKYEADDQRGLITITTRFSGNFYEVKLADTGIGIKKADYKRIFDQGFSTKQLGRVTGNGLAIVYDILVKRHKGTIEFKSVEGKGTEFTLRVPIK